jgi:hypothetical protein
MNNNISIETTRTIKIKLTGEDIVQLLIDNKTLPADVDKPRVAVTFDGREVDTSDPVIVCYSTTEYTEDGEI